MQDAICKSKAHKPVKARGTRSNGARREAIIDIVNEFITLFLFVLQLDALPIALPSLGKMVLDFPPPETPSRPMYRIDGGELLPQLSCLPDYLPVVPCNAEMSL